MYKAVLIAAAMFQLVAVQSAFSQFTVKLPKLPTVSKPKPAPDQKTETPGGGATTIDIATSARSNDTDPTIAKDSVQVRAFTLPAYRKNSAIWSWVPDMKFSVNGPIASGSQLYVEFAMPAGGPWVRLECKTAPVGPGFSHNTECGGREVPDDKGSTHTGPVNFSIKLRNELAGGDMTLFAGKLKVAKVKSNATAPNTANHFVYYVDHDWNLPIAYLFYEGDMQWDPDRPERWAKPKFSLAFWTRGETNGFAQPHIFFGGKEVGKVYYNGKEVGVPNCSVTEAQNAPTHITSPEGQFIWTRWKCTFYNVIPWNRTRDSNETLFGRLFLLSENPGQYEIKIMHNGRLIRSFKFDVDAGGKIADNRIAASNKLGSDRIIVPTQVLGDRDGPWDRNAWKTDAFYGNPLTGFTAP